MTTSDGPGAPAPADVPAAPFDLDLAFAIGREIARFAAASPAASVPPAPPIPGPIVQPPIAAAPPPKESDLRALPTMLSASAGLPSFADPPSPGLPSPPYALAPGVPSLPYAPSAGVPSVPYASVPARSSPLAAPVDPSSTPYFLDIAGPPRAAAAPSHAIDGPPPPAVVSSHDFEPELVAVRSASSRPLEPHIVKRDFPILEERVHGRRLVWLDNAATTQKPRAVIERLTWYYEHENSNVHRAAHALAARATDAYEAARATVRRFLNAPSAQEIVFVRGATEGINLVAQSWGRRNVGPGDEIVITWLEHHANIVPWQQLCREKGARLRVAPVDSHGQVLLDEYEKLLGPRTRIAAFTHVSNALGTIVPVREMIEMAHRHGALALVDGAQAVSHMPVDVQALDCDFYVFSGHKLFGPTGIGAVFGKARVLEAMPPWQGGGNMISDVTFEKTTYQPPPVRFEAGTGNIADAAGLGAAIDYVTTLGLENIRDYEHGLLGYATDCLSRVPGLRIIGDAPEKAGVLSFILDGVRTEDVGAALDQEGIAVRSGHHCAQPILRHFGLESTVRASLAPYNSRDDVDALAAALRRLQVARPPDVR